VLLVEDVARSADYYCDALGFETSRWEVNPDHYGYASRDGCHLHFARFEGARSRPNHEEAPRTCSTSTFGSKTSRPCTRSSPVAMRSFSTGRWSRRTGSMRSRAPDPDGYILAFGQRVG
jgi:catechol 2,3-dioxygenase-like lactoylglutathione lyase family enzyme